MQAASTNTGYVTKIDGKNVKVSECASVDLIRRSDELQKESEALRKLLGQ